MTDDYLRALADLLRPTIESVLREELRALSQGSNTGEDFINIDEAAHITGLAKSTIYLRTSPAFVKKHGKTIPFCKQGKRLYFRRSEILKWLSGESGAMII